MVRAAKAASRGDWSQGSRALIASTPKEAIRSRNSMRVNPSAASAARRSSARLLPASDDSLIPPIVDARVYLSYHARNAREQVKGLGYRWNAQHRYSARSLAADGLDPDPLLGQDWAAQPERVVVIGESGETLLDHRPPGTPAVAGEATSGMA